MRLWTTGLLTLAPLALAMGAAPAPDPTGQADSTPAFMAAARAAPPIVAIPPGTYRLDGVVDAPGQAWTLSGTRFVGPGVIASTVNWAPFLNRIAQGWILHTDHPSGDATTVTTLQIGVTHAASSYEKAAGIDVVGTSDPSDLEGSGTAWTARVSKDAVARLVQAHVLAGNRHGSIAALNAQASFDAGSDGSGSAAEFDMENHGTDTALLDQPNTKVGLSSVAIGPLPSTVAAMVARSGTGQWHDGVLVRQDAVSGTAFRVLATGSLTRDTFHVTPTGEVAGRSLVVRGHLGALRPALPSVSVGRLRPGSGDLRGAVELPPGSTAATITFAEAFAAAPFCVVSGSRTTAVAAVTAATPATVQLALSANAAGDTLTWHCLE